MRVFLTVAITGETDENEGIGGRTARVNKRKRKKESSIY